MSFYMNCFPDPQGPAYGLCWHKESDITLPAPTQAFVFVDEHENSIFDAAFINTTPGLDPLKTGTWSWIDFPATRHNNGANISFADGHAGPWHWREPNTITASRKPPWLIDPPVPAVNNDRDLRRFIKATKPVDLDAWLAIPD